MFILDHKTDNLWQGGPWEQPNPTFPSPPAVIIPAHAMRPPRPILRKRRRRRKLPWFAGILALVAALCLFTLILDIHLWISSGSSHSTSPRYENQWDQEEYCTDPPAIPPAATGTGVTLSLLQPTQEALSYAQIYEKNAPSMVSIEASTDEGHSTGAGIILTQDGYIITNAHVVAGAQAVRVILYNNSTFTASLVGFDADEDLAVLKIEAQHLVPAEFGDSSALQHGDPVAALGDPLGYRSTITDGIVSSLDREVEVDDITMTLIQTSAAINFGNSGGALINQYGQVVGVTTIKIVAPDGSAEGMGFAIPSQRVKYVVDALIDGREIRTGVFGFSVYTLPAEEGGLELMEVDKRSDAWSKGLRAGDILIAANGQPIHATQDLTRVKQSLGPGDTVTLTYLRRGQTYTAQVALVDADLLK